MSASRVLASTSSSKNKDSLSRRREQRGRGDNTVLAERNPAVVAVGAWVEDGQDFLQHPSALALITEELQAERRRKNEESLQRFQDVVRHRVAQQVQVFKRRRQPQTEQMGKPVRRTPQHYGVWTQHVPAGEKGMSEGVAVRQRVMEQSSQESSEERRPVRLRLAARQMSPHGEMISDLSGGKWNKSPTRHKAECHVLRAEQEAVEHEEDVQREEEGYDSFFSSRHECPLVQQKGCGRAVWDTDTSQPDPGFKSSLRFTQVLWPLDDKEELKRQRQFLFLMQRRHFLNTEREQVKENKQHRKHLKRTASIKAEKEQYRLAEERKLESARQFAEARQQLEERELLILERLKLEEEDRAVELQRRRKEEKRKVSTRFIEALRAQMKEKLSLAKPELPPLCCCGSSFWDSHPDTCANNCVFYDNPKAYAQALHSTMLSVGLR